MAKIKIGDIFEINTSKGNAYLHYIYQDKSVGDLIRVLPGLYSDRPSNLDKLVRSKERYMVFFPLSSANKRKIIEWVGFYPSDDFQKPKYMRTEHIIKGEFLGWHIIDTDTWQRQSVKEITNEQKRLSPWGIWNDTLLIENLTNDWSPENWN